ncbi:MAG: HAD family hydrolase [Methanomicrobium sp.]|nr:HAD family hydrolase [Methanomicrobium sp.]
MKKITGIIFEIDGVLYSGEEAVDGACYALNLIADAKNAGISGALVRTGKFRENKLISSGIKPDFILNSVSNLPEILDLK